QDELPQIITNWKATLLNYDFECVYRPGLSNIIPDALSRAYPDELWSPPESSSQSSTSKHKIAAATRLKQKKIAPPSEHEPSVISSAELAASLTPVSINANAPYAHVIQSEDMQKDTVLNFSERKQILKSVHEFGHLG
ncbi:hypothetical protein BGZ70_006130, partial [Mortierella alpina]